MLDIDCVVVYNWCMGNTNYTPSLQSGSHIRQVAKGETMTRQEKYHETSTFHFYNANPKNRTGAGDCVFRAISTALDQPWDQTLRELTEIAIKTGYAPNDPQTYTKYLQQKGFGKCRSPSSF